MTMALIVSLSLAGACPPPQVPGGSGRELVCRGYEDSGNVTEDQPMWPAHLVTLFVTGKNPYSCARSLQEHVDWAGEPAHSYVADGTGALVVWAHPRATDAEAMVGLKGLTGMELSHGGRSAAREELWDQVLTLCHDRGRSYLWGFAADDTHSAKPERIGLSFMEARLKELSEKALKKAFREGAFYASNGPLISDVQVQGGKVSVKLPRAADVRWLKSGQWGAGEAVVGPEPGENHCLRRDKRVRESGYALNEADGTADPGAARFVRALVIDGKRRIAQTMPFKILGPAKLENPYPAKGGWYRGMTHNHCDATGAKRRPVLAYHRAYKAIGHHWAFATDYGYWLTPFQRHPEGAIPVIGGLNPDRFAGGRPVEVELRGERLGGKDKLLVGGRPVENAKWLFENRLRFTPPQDLPVGVHDVTLVTPGGFQETLPAALTVQEPGAANAGWRTFTTLNSPLPGDRTLCVAAGRKRGVWVGTQYGAARFDGRGWKVFTRKTHTAIGDAILSIAPDRRGNVWMGHFRGLTRIAPDGGMEIFRTEHGLASRQVNQVLATSRGELWISYNGGSGGVSRSRDGGKTWEHLRPPNAKGRRLGAGLAEDREGRVLFAAHNRGVAVFDDGRWKVWDESNSGLADDYVRRMFVDRGGAVYFATTHPGFEPAGGLCILRDGKWETHEEERGGLAGYRVWDVCVDRRGSVWCATSRGVSRLSPEGAWTTFTTRNSGLAFDLVLAVAEAPDGAMWFATARGLSRLEARRAAPPRRRR